MAMRETHALVPADFFPPVRLTALIVVVIGLPFPWEKMTTASR
jgi:hypothetical protein